MITDSLKAILAVRFLKESLAAKLINPILSLGSTALDNNCLREFESFTVSLLKEVLILKPD